MNSRDQKEYERLNREWASGRRMSVAEIIRDVALHRKAVAEHSRIICARVTARQSQSTTV